MIAWSQKVLPEFISVVKELSQALHIDPSWLMACMAFESGLTFSPSIRNGAGSGAVGLIQFMPQTAAALGTTTEELASLTAEQQLEYVGLYFDSWSNKLHTLEDVYMAILWPGAVGKPNEYVLFNKADTLHPKRYVQNAGLDLDKDGIITKAEATNRVVHLLEEGMLPWNVREEP